ncbi:synaptonemal complex central element protein 1-like isoform X9 [Canis lupus baileyi]|uniref:synaptonemal complex central element protein 1-like isoform X9 n=1 Tax=Canis lupus baileyi TaxID=143281 RepID=UPI003B97421B
MCICPRLPQPAPHSTLEKGLPRVCMRVRSAPSSTHLCPVFPALELVGLGGVRMRAAPAQGRGAARLELKPCSGAGQPTGGRAVHACAPRSLGGRGLAQRVWLVGWGFFLFCFFSSSHPRRTPAQAPRWKMAGKLESLRMEPPEVVEEAEEAEVNEEKVHLEEVLNKKQEALSILQLYCQRKESGAHRKNMLQDCTEQISIHNSQVAENCRQRKLGLHVEEQLENLMGQHKELWEFHMLKQRLAWEIRALQSSREQLLTEESRALAKLEDVERRLSSAPEAGGVQAVDDGLKAELEEFGGQGPAQAHCAPKHGACEGAICPRFPRSSASEYHVLWGSEWGACLFLRVSSTDAAAANRWPAVTSLRCETWPVSPEARGKILALRCQGGHGDQLFLVHDLQHC